MTTAIIPGSFDPPTLGHLDLISSAQRCFDRVVVAVGANPAKKPWFSTLERVAMLREATQGVEVISFDGLLVDAASRVKADCIVKGVRNAADFHYESTQAAINRDIGGIDTIFLPTAPNLAHVSSSTVKELALLGVTTEAYLPPNVAIIVANKGDNDA